MEPNYKEKQDKNLKMKRMNLLRKERNFSFFFYPSAGARRQKKFSESRERIRKTRIRKIDQIPKFSMNFLKF